MVAIVERSSEHVHTIYYFLNEDEWFDLEKTRPAHPINALTNGLRAADLQVLADSHSRWR